MEIPITQRLLRRDLNSKQMRNRIQRYNNSLKDNNLKDNYPIFKVNSNKITLKKELNKKIKEVKENEFKHLRKRFNQRGGRNRLPELIELEKRGFF